MYKINFQTEMKPKDLDYLYLICYIVEILNDYYSY